MKGNSSKKLTHGSPNNCTVICSMSGATRLNCGTLRTAPNGNAKIWTHLSSFVLLGSSTALTPHDASLSANGHCLLATSKS